MTLSGNDAIVRKDYQCVTRESVIASRKKTGVATGCDVQLLLRWKGFKSVMLLYLLARGGIASSVGEKDVEMAVIEEFLRFFIFTVDIDERAFIGLYDFSNQFIIT